MLLGRKKFAIKEKKDLWVATKTSKVKLPSQIIPLFSKIDERNIDLEVEKLRGPADGNAIQQG